MSEKIIPIQDHNWEEKARQAGLSEVDITFVIALRYILSDKWGKGTPLPFSPPKKRD